jgi:aspartate carbamoyltransferase catalytic subunit
MQQTFGQDLSSLRVLIVGDIKHSRVARSNALLLTQLGAKVELAGPESLLPKELGALGVSVSHNLDDSLVSQPDVVMMLRVQRERMLENFQADESDYIKQWSLSRARLASLSNQAIIMHPGPINRGLEISPEAAEDPRSKILEQVKNGLAVRMAVLYQVLSEEA